MYNFFRGLVLKKTVLVSVIMTVFNGEKYLKRAIDSVLRQSLSDFEFIIVNDGSDDGTRAILEEASTDHRITIVNLDRVGRGRALNLAWKRARGDFIANLDVDDIALSSRLEKQVNYLIEHSNVGLLGTAARVINEDLQSEYVTNNFLQDKELKAALVKGNPFVHSSVMMPRSTLVDVNGYDSDLKVLLDYDLWARIATKHQIANLSDILTIKSQNESAFFSNRISDWTKCKGQIRIRWFAWKNFSRKVSDFQYVLIIPLAKYLYVRFGIQQLAKFTFRRT